MNRRRTYHNRLGNMEFLQKIFLCFLIGFFCGAVFYYVFQNSFDGVREQLINNAQLWSAGDSSFLTLFCRSAWGHGKYFLLLWLLSVSRIRDLYQKVFTVYTGLRNGFLVLFFLYAEGIYGLFLYAASLFPHVLLFAPLYGFSFLVIHERRQVRHKVLFVLLLAFVFCMACLLEVKCNFPLMGALL